MAEQKRNGLATSEDFERAAEARESRPERVVLPKLGKAVLLRRPSPVWFVFRGRLPQSLAARIADQGAMVGAERVATAQDVAELADWIVAILQETVLEPRISLNPGPGEIPPELLDIEDVNFILRWAYGELRTESEGSAASLDSFRAEREPAGVGPGGRDVVLPSQ
jgi:hypothetical protein